MSGYSIVHEVGLTLRRVLHARFDEDAEALGLLSGNSEAERISLAPPEVEKGIAKSSLSLWLYLVSEQEHSKNRPRTVLPDGSQIPPPLALSLYYLVTPGAPGTANPEDRLSRVQRILGKVMQTFFTWPIIAVIDPTSANAEELHLSLCRINLEELTRVWEALNQAYQLSVCYRVNIARIRHLEVSKGALIVERDPMLGIRERREVRAA